MKTLFISVATAALLLTACSSNKTAETEAPAAAPQVSLEEAIAQCQQSAGQPTDTAAFDACMKDKGFQRQAGNQAPAAAPASAAK
ncbi:hypothetical protein [Neisseria sp. CCUG12390]|uniref:hypothetical protein n=1 Tax=Neisseria sp. CCUG12390 TaxID=3392035 RepID=UPI003A100FE8